MWTEVRSVRSASCWYHANDKHHATLTSSVVHKSCFLLGCHAGAPPGTTQRSAAASTRPAGAPQFPGADIVDQGGEYFAAAGPEKETTEECGQQEQPR